MNNKGQSLATFILLLPLIFLIIVGVYDIGSLELEKGKIDSEIKSSITYGLKNINDPNIKQKIHVILDKNITGEKSININGKSIQITYKNTINSIFTNIIKNGYEISQTYTGYIKDGKIIIEKE